jgi:hypothetical protein
MQRCLRLKSSLKVGLVVFFDFELDWCFDMDLWNLVFDIKYYFIVLSHMNANF